MRDNRLACPSDPNRERKTNYGSPDRSDCGRRGSDCKSGCKLSSALSDYAVLAQGRRCRKLLTILRTPDFGVIRPKFKSYLRSQSRESTSKLKSATDRRSG
jgi:hypothetical protein